MELWDAYTKQGERIDGVVLVRGEPVPQGMYHMACGVIVRHRDGSILCMKRAKEKKSFAGWYDVSAGGAALQGENKFDCIKRELREETGIACDEFVELGSYVGDKSRIILYNFLCTVDWPKDSVTLQPGETEGYIWMNEAEFAAFANSGRMIEWQKAQYHDYMVQQGWVAE